MHKICLLGLYNIITGYQFCEHLDYKTPKLPREEVSLAIAGLYNVHVYVKPSLATAGLYNVHVYVKLRFV